MHMPVRGPCVLAGGCVWRVNVAKGLTDNGDFPKPKPFTEHEGLNVVCVPTITGHGFSG